MVKEHEKWIEYYCSDLNRLKKITTIACVKLSIIIIVLQIISCIPFLILFGKEREVYIWFMYCFPIFRLGDFFDRVLFGKNLHITK